MANTLPDPQYTAPASADGISASLPGSAWADGTPVELIAALDADGILTGLTLRPNGTLFLGYAFEAVVCTGAAGFEVPIATLRAFLVEVNASIGGFGLYLPTTIGIDNLPNGERVSAFLRGDTAATTAFRLSITYLKKPLSGTLLTTANALISIPNATDSFVVTAGVSWAAGAAVEIRGNEGPSIALTAVIITTSAATLEWELEILVGDAADPGPTIRGSNGGVSSLPNYYMLPHPFVVPAATSVSVTFRTTSVAARTATVAFNAVELPL